MNNDIPAPLPNDLIIGLGLAPQALWEWLAQLRHQYPSACMGLCLKQPAKPNAPIQPDQHAPRRTRLRSATPRRMNAKN